MNYQIFLNLVHNYIRLSYAKDYIIGFNYHGVVYMVILDDSNIQNICSLDRASRGAGYALRFRPNKAVKEYLMTLAPIALCSVDCFKGMVADSRYNKGEIFEKMVTEYFGQHWEKDSVPFTVDGDLTVDGIAYQIKYEGATFTNEKLLLHLMAR